MKVEYVKNKILFARTLLIKENLHQPGNFITAKFVQGCSNFVGKLHRRIILGSKSACEKPSASYLKLLQVFPNALVKS